MIRNLTNSKLNELNALKQEREQQPENDWLDTLTRNGQGQIKKTSVLNVTKIFQNDEYLANLVRMNDFTKRMELYKNLDVFKLRQGELNRVNVQVRNYIEQTYHVCFDDNYLIPGMMSYLYNQSYEHEYNPVKDRIKSVEWDGKKRVETFFIDYLGALDTPLNREITRKWLIGAVARPFHPGIKMDLMPILVGEQGKGKSTMCSALCPLDKDGNRQYFNDNLTALNGKNNDDLQKVHNNWILEIAELSSFNSSKIEDTKQFISQQHDEYRLPYDRLDESQLRTNVFIGTTNSEDFLKDRTGNRRFLPIKINQQEPTKDFANIDDDDIKQVLAEAYYYFTQGEKPVISDSMQDTLAMLQNDYMAVDVAEEQIKEYANMLVPSDWDAYNNDDKESYYNRVINRSRYEDKNGHILDPENLIKMPKFTTMEIAKFVLLTNSTRGNTGKKISSVMQAMPEFRNTRIKNKHGYVRK